ncbi:MAG: porin family protein [Phenylobacterium sp.]|uniref:porin family protein n=1 Tax=Phenylobacterium sp. TaxID=1871053 RepID=UPI001A43F3EC|nr:porin family protein [Phenylobacterium sp.]MBL8771328.1 porin family protein [Phenylobacterium sp.]
MKLMIAAATVAAALACAPAMAQAQDAAGAPGAYVNIGGAYSSQSGIDLGAIQAKVGYRFSPYLGVEGEAAFGVDDDSLRVGATRAKIELKHQFAAYVVGFLPVGANTDLLARVGYGTTKIGASAAGVGASGSDESVNLGVGLQHHFDGVNGIRVEYLRSEYDGGGDSDTFGVSYVRRF